MSTGTDGLLTELKNIVSRSQDRIALLRDVARVIQSHRPYRWVGLYEVDHAAGEVRNIVWSGPDAPEYLTFPITKGLTGAAVAGQKAVNAGDVSADPLYLTALGSTRSEIIVPVFDPAGTVVGTIDVESEEVNAFDEEVQAFLQSCSEIIRPLWTN